MHEGWPESLGPVICVVGARPNFIKMAPILRAFSDNSLPIPYRLVHTGQHYDHAMSDNLFEELQLPRPDINLEVGSASHTVQTAEIMLRFEPVLDQFSPACVLVVGDVNSTLACALVAQKKGIPVVHVEAGLRSGDRSMPEEINRILTDQIADLLYTTERAATDNLSREGIDIASIRFVGNVMIDSLHHHRNAYRKAEDCLIAAGIDPRLISDADAYGVVTLHRPSNVDNGQILGLLLDTLREISENLPLVFALHPRTRQKIAEFDLTDKIDSKRMILVPAQGYLEMLGLLADAKIVLTDSGGLQEEATALGVPCLTLRDTTERPITVSQGTNIVVGQDIDAIRFHAGEILAGRGKAGKIPEYWDGQAARRIAADLSEWLIKNHKQPH